MTTDQQTIRTLQGRYRPAVRRAWETVCAARHSDPGDRSAHDAWYRNSLRDIAGIDTTSGASPAQLETLIEAFTALCGLQVEPPIVVTIYGWTPSQCGQFNRLVGKAWRVTQSRVAIDVSFESWVDSHLSSAGLKDRFAPDRTESFDTAMAAFAVIVGDEYWITRTAFASEIRMRWVITNLLVTLSDLTGQSCDWSYARGIYSQMSLPLTIDETPAQLLWKVLQALDTHVRRLSR